MVVGSRVGAVRYQAKRRHASEIEVQGADCRFNRPMIDSKRHALLLLLKVGIGFEIVRG